MTDLSYQTRLRVVRPGAPADFSPSAQYTVTVPRPSIAEGADQLFGTDPSRQGTRFGRIDATALIEPSRWERVYARWLADRTGAEVEWHERLPGPPHPMSQSLAETDAWKGGEVPEGVRVRRATTRRGEARAVVRDIRAWLRQQGLGGPPAARALDDVWILVPGRPEVFALWHRELSLADIPVRSHHFEPIGRHSIARWIVGLVELSDWAVHPVARDHLRGVVEARHWSARAVTDNEDIGLRRGLRKLLTRMRRDSFRYDEWIQHVHATADPEMRDAVVGLSTRLAESLAQGPRYFDRLDRLLSELELRACSQVTGDPVAIVVAEKALRLIRELAYVEAKNGGTHPDAHAGLTAVIEAAFRTQWVKLTTEHRHGVRLVAYDAYDGSESRLLFATGLGEGDFPAIPARWNAAEERTARELGLLGADETVQDYVDDEIERQIRLATCAFDRCHGEVVLSYAIQAPGTEQRYPGPMLSLLVGGWSESHWVGGAERVEVFGWADEIPRNPADADCWGDVALFAEDARFRRFLRDVDNEETLPAEDSARIGDIRARADQLVTSREAVRERRPRPDEQPMFGAHSGILPGRATRPLAYSASALEAYGQCGGKYFFGKVLRVSDDLDLSEALEATETGTIIHNAFAAATHDVVDVESRTLWSMCIEPGESKEDAVARIQRVLSRHLEDAVRAFLAEQASMSEALVSAVVRRWSGAIEKWLFNHVVPRHPGQPTMEELGRDPDVASARNKLDDLQLAIAAVEALATGIVNGEITTQAKAGELCPDGMRSPISKTALVAAYKDGSCEALLEKLHDENAQAELALAQVEELTRQTWATHFNRDVVHGELAFGMLRGDSDPASSENPVTVYVEDVAVPVHGQVDRVDWDQDRNQIAVRDYKTGRRRSAKVLTDEIAAGQHLQLPLYAMAIEELARQGVLPHLADATTAEISLEFPRDPVDARWHATVRLDQPSGHEMQGTSAKWSSISRAWLRSHVHHLEKGQFPLLPGKCPIENTGYCDFDRVCGYTTEFGSRAEDPRRRRPVVTPFEEEKTSDKLPCPEVIAPRCRGQEPDVEAVRATHELAGHAAADISRDVAIAAGAGTGKTYNLVLRYLAALAAGATPNEILCITFTRRAASEMKKRIREALLSEPSGPQQPYVEALRADRGRFRRLLLQLSAAPITTIDAFAGNVFREVQSWKAQQQGLAAPPLEVVTDDDVAEQLRTYVRQQFIAAIEANDPHLHYLAERLDPLSVRDLLLEASKRDISEELAQIDTLHGRSAYLIRSWYRLMEPAAAQLFELVARWPLDEMLANLAEAEGASAAGSRPTDEGAEWLRSFVQRVRRGPDATPQDWTFIHEVMTRSTAKKHFGHADIGPALRDGRTDVWDAIGQNDPERVEACKEWLKALDQLDEFAETAAHATFVAERWARGFRDYLVSSSRVRFSDVELLAMQALEDTATADAIGSRFRYRHIFVDEVQDTSYSQIRLIQAARRVAEAATGAPCNEFVVGDVKQSIYGFRGAEVDVFTRRVADGAHTFTVNRRSTPGLIRAFNRLFDALFGAECDGVRLDARAVMPYEPLVWPKDLGGGGAPVTDAGIELFCAPGESWFHVEETEDVEEEDEAEIFKATPLQRGLARRITELVDQFPPGDNGASIAILVGSWARADFYRDLLNAYDVPAAVQGGRGLLSTPEVDGLVQWLEAAAFPNLRTSFLAALRGPGISVSEAGLYCLRMGYGVEVPDREPPYYLKAAVFGGFSVEEALRAWFDADPELDTDRAAYLLSRDAESLTRFRAVWDALPSRLGVEAPSATLAWLADELGLWTFWHSCEGGRQAVANLRSLLDLVRDLEANLGQDPWVILRRLAEMRGNSDPAAGGLDASGGAPVVITTYWQAKGLEWPVVVLPDIEKTKIRGDAKGLGDNRICIVDADFDVVHTPEIRVSQEDNPIRSATTAITNVLDQYRKPAKRAELRRLLYVAMTRARDKLVLSGTFDVPTKKADEVAPTALHDAKDWATTLRVCLGLHVPEGAHVLQTASDSPWAELESDGTVQVIDGIEYGAGAMQKVAARPTVELPQSRADATRWLTIPATRVNLVRPSDMVEQAVPPPNPELSTTLPERQDLRITPFDNDADHGTAFHLLMERSAFLDDDLEPLCGQILEELRLDLPADRRAERIAAMLELADSALQCGVAAELRAAADRGQLYHELPLDFLLDDTRRVYGVIDLVWQDEAGTFHVLDYKTGFRYPTLDEPETRQLHHHYAQTQLYAAGLERCGLDVGTFGIWYVAAPAVLRWAT